MLFHLFTTAVSLFEELTQSVSLLSDLRLFLGFPNLSKIYNYLILNFSGMTPSNYVLNSKVYTYFISSAVVLESLSQNTLKSLEESTSQVRVQRAQNPVFKPDFKSGNYFTRDDFARKPFLLTTISDISKGMRRPA
jgi:hypothetical protein